MTTKSDLFLGCCHTSSSEFHNVILRSVKTVSAKSGKSYKCLSEISAHLKTKSPREAETPPEALKLTYESTCQAAGLTSRRLHVQYRPPSGGCGGEASSLLRVWN